LLFCKPPQRSPGNLADRTRAFCELLMGHIGCAFACFCQQLPCQSSPNGTKGEVFNKGLQFAELLCHITQGCQRKIGVFLDKLKDIFTLQEETFNMAPSFRGGWVWLAIKDGYGIEIFPWTNDVENLLTTIRGGTG
jgi:hypothetical protein